MKAKHIMAKRAKILVSLVTGLLLARVALAAPSAATVDWWYIGGGGSDTAGVNSLNGMIGQPLIGMDSEGVYDLCAGFLCGIAASTHSVYDLKIYLPIIVRDLG